MSQSQDYRLTGQKLENVYLVKESPTSEKENKLLEEQFRLLIFPDTGRPDEIQIGNRMITIPVAAGEVAMMRYRDICENDYGPEEYMMICKRYSTIFLLDIPRIPVMWRDRLRRFILFIDEVYQRRVKFLCTADEIPERLLLVDNIVQHHDQRIKGDFNEEVKIMTNTNDESFAFRRTISRLHEFQTKEYLIGANIRSKR